MHSHDPQAQHDAQDIAARLDTTRRQPREWPVRRAKELAHGQQSYFRNLQPYKSLKHVDKVLGETGHRGIKAVRLQDGKLTNDPQVVLEEVLNRTVPNGKHHHSGPGGHHPTPRTSHPEQDAGPPMSGHTPRPLPSAPRLAQQVGPGRSHAQTPPHELDSHSGPMGKYVRHTTCFGARTSGNYHRPHHAGTRPTIGRRNKWSMYQAPQCQRYSSWHPTDSKPLCDLAERGASCGWYRRPRHEPSVRHRCRRTT